MADDSAAHDTPEAPNTRLCYRYRDAANYHMSGTVVFAGRLDAAAAEAFEAALDDGQFFIAEQVGVPSLREQMTPSISEDDHVWHEFEGWEATAAAPTDPRTAAAFVAEVAACEWDVLAAAAALGV